MDICRDLKHREIEEKLTRSSDFTKNVEYASGIFSLLAEPSRVKILLALAEGELCVYHICDIVGAKQSATSQHLKKLKDARLIKCKKVGNQVLYSLLDEHVISIIDTMIKHKDCK